MRPAVAKLDISGSDLTTQVSRTSTAVRVPALRSEITSLCIYSYCVVCRCAAPAAEGAGEAGALCGPRCAAAVGPAG
jgi:hypothetical protein